MSEKADELERDLGWTPYSGHAVAAACAEIAEDAIAALRASESEVARLTAERDEARAFAIRHQAKAWVAEGQAEGAELDLARLRERVEALGEYTRHVRYCPAPEAECACGLAALLNEAPR
jgi:hypothetical protein